MTSLLYIVFPVIKSKLFLEYLLYTETKIRDPASLGGCIVRGVGSEAWAQTELGSNLVSRTLFP